MGGPGVAAVRARDRLVRCTAHGSPLSRDAVRRSVPEQFQSQPRRRRPAGLGFGGPFRARPGYRGDDDRKPSQPTDLAADARLPLCWYRIAACRIPRRLAVETLRRRIATMPQNAPSPTIPQDAYERRRLENV